MNSVIIPTITRRARFVLATGGLLLLVVAGWLARERSAMAPADGALPLELVVHPPLPGGIYRGRESEVRPTLVEALALEKEVSFSRRTALLRSTGGGLVDTEIDLLVAALLAEKPPPEAPEAHSTWFNEIANLLHRQPAARERLARALATVAADSSRDATLRDYALQHLRVVWNDADANPGLRASITASLRRLVGNDKVLSTSALLSLHLLGDSAAVPDSPVARALPDDDVTSLAGGMLDGPAGSRQPAERMTAARIAADRKLTSLRPALARIASDPAEHMLSRISAISAIGHIGNPADRSLLESLSFTEPSLAAATHKALESLR